MPLHDDAQFSTPVPLSSDPLLEDRTQPFPVSRLEIYSDPERAVQNIVVTHHNQKGYTERYVHVVKWLALLTVGFMLNRLVVCLNVPCMFLFSPLSHKD